MTGATKKDTKKAGCIARIVKGNTRPSDILVHFYQARLTDEQKIRQAIEKGYTIPLDYVQKTREMYLEGTLNTDKPYTISPGFIDPDMRPMKTHPQYEQNPAYKQECARRIHKFGKDRVFKIVPDYVVEVMRSAEMDKIRLENMECILAPRNALMQKKMEFKKKMPIPRYNENNMIDPFVNKENMEKYKDKYINHENVDPDMRVVFRHMMASMTSDPTNVKYCNQDDFVEKVTQETIPIVNVKTNITEVPYKTEEQKRKEFREKWRKDPDIMMLQKHNKRRVDEQDIIDRNRRERLNKEAEDLRIRRAIAEIDAIQPAESGEEFDQKIMLKLKLKSTANRPCSIDNETSLRIALSEERTENTMEMAVANENEAIKIVASNENYDMEMEETYEKENENVVIPAEIDNEVLGVAEVLTISSVQINEVSGTAEVAEIETMPSEFVSIPTDEIDNEVPGVADVVTITAVEIENEIPGVAEAMTIPNEILELSAVEIDEEIPGVAEAMTIPSEFVTIPAIEIDNEVPGVAEVAAISREIEAISTVEMDNEVAEVADVVAISSEITAISAVEKDNEVVDVAEIVGTTETFVKDFGDVYLFTMHNVEQEIEVSTEPTSERTTDPEDVITQSTSEAQATSSTAKPVKPEKKKITVNPWEEIVNEAEDIFIRNSAPQSIVSSTPSALEIEQMLSRPWTGPAKKTFITINDESASNSQAAPSPTPSTSTKAKTRRGRPKKTVRGKPLKTPKPRRELPPHPDDDPLLTQSGPLDGRKPLGRPRKNYADKIGIEQLADIVVQSSLAAPQPHQFPRPDLKPFQEEVLQKPQNFSSDSFMTPKTITVPSPVKFAQPDMNRFVADCAAKSSGTKRKSVGSQDDVVSLNSIGSEGPPVKKSKPSTENDDEQQSSSSSLLPPPSARPARSRRSYISKNNPKIRHRRTAELAASGEPEGSGDDATSLTSSQSWAAPNRLNPSVNSRTSSIAGDYEDQVSWVTRNPPTFGDPQPPPEVTIDEEVEAKPELPLPPPIHTHSRQSKKKQREIAAQKEKEIKMELVEEDPDVIYIKTSKKRGFDCVRASAQGEKGEPLREPKIEEEEDNDVLNVELPVTVVEVNLPVEEENNSPPKTASMLQSDVTHWFTTNAKTYQALNELFFCDPKVFEDLVFCLLEDENNEGNTFKQSVQNTNQTTPYSAEFIKFLASSPRDGALSRNDLLDYGTYTRAMRMRCSLSDVLTKGLSPNRFFDNVEEIQDLKKRLDSNLPRRLTMNTVERELLNKTESILVGRCIESTLKVATLSSIEWTTKDHVRRRFEMLLYGWREFLKKGGFLKVLVALIEIEEKKPKDEFIELIKRILNECESNVSQAVSLLNMSDEELEAKIAADSNLTREQFMEVRNDMSREKTESHIFECSQCKQGLNLNIYFSNVNLLKLHESLHRAEECTLCYDDCPNVLLHTIKTHWSILNEY